MAQTNGTPLHFIPPGPIARAVNRLYSSLTRLGLSMPYSFLLSVPGRRTGETVERQVVFGSDPRTYAMGAQRL
jgi:hypothetical protein